MVLGVRIAKWYTLYSPRRRTPASVSPGLLGEPLVYQSKVSVLQERQFDPVR